MNEIQTLYYQIQTIILQIVVELTSFATNSESNGIIDMEGGKNTIIHFEGHPGNFDRIFCPNKLNVAVQIIRNTINKKRPPI